MKKALALLMAAALSLSLVACGGSSASSAAPATSSGTASSTVSGAGTSLLTDKERADSFITVATGPTSGIYFPIGGAFATALSDWGYTTTAQATAASAENIQLILDGDAEIAIAMQDSVMQAYEGFGAYDGKEPAKDLRAVMRLWPNYVQLVTTANTGIKSVEDLKGKRVGVGAANSGVELNARMIVEAYGMSYSDFTPDYLAYGEAIDNMKNGQCDAVFVTSGLPNSTVTELATSYDMVIVPIDGAGRDTLVEKYPFYAPTVIPADTYNNKEDVQGVFVYNILVCNADLPDNQVYDMLTGIFENIDTIKASHNAANKNISLDVGVEDLAIPLHAGAEAFWKEKGFVK
ncbi:TAXI family TRAP transporter solute-binding subunit [Pygmaiobacter massiliensis]|uniref:TAXI family TRAP transporter solute-binding subunit n=1 Tax=Pygmaiobacter massiliensis TaxID=1917873 RepID=UPI000C7D0C6B|nr:TAXI family TRAP transporter solute-binding subunit [Pygmaiobacter massiliensis]